MNGIVDTLPVAATAEPEEAEDEAEDDLEEMKSRLEALRS